MPDQLNRARGDVRARRCAFLFAVAAITCASGARAGGQGGATAHDLYVGCHRFVENVPDAPSALPAPAGDSARWCEHLVTATEYQAQLNALHVDTQGRFCLPRHLLWMPYARKAIAYSFLAYYDRAGDKLADADGAETMAAAMLEKWPCQPIGGVAR